MQLLNLPINKIRPDPRQPRRTFDKDHIANMADSIRTEGVINPIEIDSTYTIITGELRYRAAKKAGLELVPCKMIKIKPEERFRRQVIENIHHNTMTDYDTAVALSKLIKLPRGGKSGKGYNLGESELAKEIGKSQQFISEKLAILKTSAKLQTAIKRQEISVTALRAISRTPNEFKKTMERKILKQEFSSNEAAIEVAMALTRSPDMGDKILSLNFKELPTRRDVMMAVNKYSPSVEDQVREKLSPASDLANIKNDLLMWFHKNPPNEIINLNIGQITLTLDLMAKAIYTYSELAGNVKKLDNNAKYRS